MNIKFQYINEYDIRFINEVRNSSVSYLHDNRTFTLEETKEWYKNTKPMWFIIWDTDYFPRERIGYFRLSELDSFLRSINIGCDIHEIHRNKGYAKKAYPVFMKLLIDLYGIKDFWLEVLENNKVAHKLYKDLGFRYSSDYIYEKPDGTKEKSIYMRYEA